MPILRTMFLTRLLFKVNLVKEQKLDVQKNVNFSLLFSQLPFG